MAEVQASNEYLTYKPLLDEQQAALKAYDEAKTNYNTAVEEAATAASTLTAAVTAQKAAAEKYDEIKDYNDKGQATDWELKQAEKAKDDAIKALENAQADNAAKQTALQNATQVQAAAKTRMDQANDAVNNSADKYAFLTLLWTLANTEEYKGTKENPGILYDYSGTTNSQFIENTILDYSILAGHQARAIESAEDAEKQVLYARSQLQSKRALLGFASGKGCTVCGAEGTEGHKAGCTAEDPEMKPEGSDSAWAKLKALAAVANVSYTVTEDDKNNIVSFAFTNNPGMSQLQQAYETGRKAYQDFAAVSGDVKE